MGNPFRAALLFGAWSALSCGGEHSAPVSEQLAVGLRPAAAPESERAWDEALRNDGVRDDGDGSASESGVPRLVPAGPNAFWVRAPVEAAGWKPLARFTDVWFARRPFVGTGVRPDGAPRRLVTTEGELRLMSLESGHPEATGTFAVQGPNLLQRTEPGRRPEAAWLWEYVDLGSASDGACHAALEGFFGEGFVLAPGFPQRVDRVLDGPSTLLFTSVTPEVGVLGREIRLEVWRGEERVSSELLSPTTHPVVREHRVELPAAGEESFSFRVSGAAAVVAVFGPTLFPTPSSPRPPRRNAVLFIADTFRADNLEAGSGPAFLTPALNRWAKSARVFTHARSAASWTLPSHATMFSALYPSQLGIRTAGEALASEVETLAEVLRRAGFRTGAITDDAFVSPEYGLAQGFEWFDARRRSPRETLAAVEAFLRADDGRPYFLVVHTYRAHHPYVVTPETAASIGEAIGLRRDLDPREFTSIPESLPGWSPSFVPEPAQARRMDDYRALYRGASADLDRLFGEVREVLERAEDAQPDVLAFTSDHGEAFWEHGIAEHGNGAWEEHLAIPLIVSGPGIEPGSSDTLAGGIDLPRTLCARLGVAPHAGWGGVDLLGPPTERPLLAFECNKAGQPTTFALYAKGKKLRFPDDGDATELDPTAAYDLALDPGERTNRIAESWVSELLRLHRAHIALALRPLVEASASKPGAKAREELDALGYGGR